MPGPYTNHSLFDVLGPHRAGTTVAADGTTLAYQVFSDAGPTVIFANGIGVRYPGLVLQIAHLMRRYRVVTWDYRGIGDSILAEPTADVTMATHAGDLLAVLDAVGAADAIVIGWSMGVQVGLEVLRQRPAAVRAFVALFGGPGRPFDNMPGPLGAAMRGLFRFSIGEPRLANLLLDFTWQQPRLSLPVLKTASFFGRDIWQPIIISNIAGVAAADKGVYFRTMLALGDHDARDVLPHVRCPSAVLAGERDYLTPPAAARQMAAAMPNASCHVFRRLTHYGLIEDPSGVNAAVDAFLATVV